MIKTKQPGKRHLLSLIASGICVGILSFSVGSARAESATSKNAQSEGVALYLDNCASCHSGEARGEERIAPPIFAVRNHYISDFSDKSTFIKAMAEWLKKPEESKAVMPGAIRKFGLMPEIELPEDAAEKIARYIYEGNFDVPEWYIEHYREEHGEDPDLSTIGGMDKGKGHGMGHGRGHDKHGKKKY